MMNTLTLKTVNHLPIWWMTSKIRFSSSLSLTRNNQPLSTWFLHSIRCIYLWKMAKKYPIPRRWTLHQLMDTFPLQRTKSKNFSLPFWSRRQNNSEKSLFISLLLHRRKIVTWDWSQELRITKPWNQNKAKFMLLNLRQKKNTLSVFIHIMRKLRKKLTFRCWSQIKTNGRK